MQVAADGLGVEGALVVAVQGFRVPVIAPGEGVGAEPARGFFPLGLGGQTPGLAGRLREPGGVGGGILMAHENDGVLLSSSRWTPVHPGVAAGALIRMDKAIALPGGFVDIGSARPVASTKTA